MPEPVETILLRLPVGTRDRLARIAEAEDRKVSEVVRLVTLRALTVYEQTGEIELRTSRAAAP